MYVTVTPVIYTDVCTTSNVQQLNMIVVQVLQHEGHPVSVSCDSGHGKGKGVFAKQASVPACMCSTRENL